MRASVGALIGIRVRPREMRQEKPGIFFNWEVGVEPWVQLGMGTRGQLPWGWVTGGCEPPHAGPGTPPVLG